MPRQHTRRVPTTPSLLRMRRRSARAPWGTRLLAAWVVLSLAFALTPCCEVIGTASAAPATASTDHGHAPDAHGGTHAPDSGDPCAVWLDHHDAVPAKAGVESPLLANLAPANPDVFLWSGAPAVPAWRPFRLSASPPAALYLRYARLIF